MKTERGRKRGARPVVFDGIGVSAGIAIGPAYVLEGGIAQVPEFAVAPEAVDAEIERFRGALARARRQVRKLRRKAEALPESVLEELGPLLDAHGAMLESSRLAGGVETAIRTRAVNAEAAVQAVVGQLVRGLEAVGDAYLASRGQDIREVGDRILRHLTATPYHAFSMLTPGTIVVAEELSPADTALMDPALVAGFATALGGADSHTAIMARSMGIPAVLGVPAVSARVRSGVRLIVDGEAGRIVVDPDPETLAEYRRKAEARRRLERQLNRLRGLPAVTTDGVRIGLQANLELPRDLDTALHGGAEGIGLLRTEFLFMNRPDLPSEDEQYAALRHMVETLDGRPVTIRTLDVGGEKLATALGERIAESANPALGLRAIRLALKEPKLLETQLAAILRAGAHGPVRILLPMISSVGQVRAVRAILARVVSRLKRRKVPIANPVPPLGVMIEVPGAALTADALARECDFMALGTNDLTMYTLAIDRGDEQVADLYNPLHPSVLRLIQFTVEAAHRNAIPVSVCGEIAGDPRYAPLLVGLGVGELSMAGTALPRVKQRIRRLAAGPATQRARAIMDQVDETRIATLLDDFNEGL
ncbi:phosphoenolpyruvate-protein phosphotransferase [Thalassobaculum fulvum]|uniref:Phosphoenolpyruvate-protein phosphotransferase n=1 Tax=Thalassobaculum fulvum TaxID=1633335 RepID=A0A918XMQ1_9PROT|nr:phosphoenolpyruvate--protein phosphotransferase [Thalassobaculum fulvum]GHD39203.1 phosphoenolpyruvate-protein phosphotransferase [Thalassobaculum fulvum]